MAYRKNRKLMVFGGGPLPVEALAEFQDWAREAAGGRRGRILLVAWASEEPELTAELLGQVLAAGGRAEVAASLEPPLTEAARAEFLAELSGATAVFFSGGDQNRIAAALENARIRDALHERYLGGTPFAGTSAGTAVMSQVMFTGDADPGALDSGAVLLGRGLGLCEGVIFDQHFLKRQRQNRLFAAILRHPERIGIGVDEGTALAILDGRAAAVRGPEKVMRVAKSGDGRSLSIEIYHSGEAFDLLSGASSPLEMVAEAAS